jgi:hypothetical protein
VYLALFWRAMLFRRALLLAWTVFGCALAWDMLFVEVQVRSGKVDVSGNFTWGAHQAIFILFLFTAFSFIHTRPRQPEDEVRSGAWRPRVVWMTLCLHTAAGIWAYVRYM